MAQVPKGTRLYIATVFGSVLATSAASNATECVLSMASTSGLSNGDFVEVTSGWGRLNLRVFRVKSLVANTSITLENADTSSTSFFPAGSGVGSVRKVSTWQEIVQVTAISNSGGGARNVNYDYLDSDVTYNINNGFEATSYNLTMDSDSISTAGYIALRSLTDVQTDTIFRIVKRSGASTLQPCKVALNESDNITNDQIMTVTCAINGNNRQTKYAS